MVTANRLGWIGVDLGTHTVKLAQAVRTPTGLMLRHAAVIQRSLSWSDDDLVLAEPQPSDVEIHAALECSRFRGRDAACLLPMNVCELRGLKIPFGEPEERRAMIANELADDWADRPAPMEFDYWEVTSEKVNEVAETFNVNVISVARPWIAQLASDCQKAQLDCWAVEGGPLAIARAVHSVTSTRNDQHVLAIDWGFSNATLCIVGNGRPLYARRLQGCSFRHCLDSIQSQLGVSLDHAQHLADVQGLALADADPADRHELQVAITDAVADPIEQLVHEVQRTLRFVETQRGHHRPTSLWLLGGGATLRNIAPYLAAALGIPVHIWKVPRDPSFEPETPANQSALFGNAFALSTLAWRAA